MKLIKKKKNIAIIAHDGRKAALLKWVMANKDILKKHNLFGTGTTGRLIEEQSNIKVHKYLSGPLGGDQQIGAAISVGDIDMLIFFWDPLEPMPHDPDVKALLRLSTMWNIPMACNQTSADFILNSKFMNTSYKRKFPKKEEYLKRDITIHI
jgi:methylglyoxal synthase